MWIKTVDNSYYNMLTGATLAVVESRAGGDFRVMVMNAGGNTALACLQKGYRTEEDAQDALDKVLEGQDLVELEVPDYEDDEEDDSESEEDEVVYNDNYDDVDDEILKNELEERGLSVRGSRRQAIARLRKDDAKRAEQEGNV